MGPSKSFKNLSAKIPELLPTDAVEITDTRNPNYVAKWRACGITFSLDETRDTHHMSLDVYISNRASPEAIDWNKVEEIVKKVADAYTQACRAKRQNASMNCSAWVNTRNKNWFPCLMQKLQEQLTD